MKTSEIRFFGLYKFEKRIYKGKYHEVFLANDYSLNKDVIIKSEPVTTKVLNLT